MSKINHQDYHYRRQSRFHIVCVCERERDRESMKTTNPQGELPVSGSDHTWPAWPTRCGISTEPCPEQGILSAIYSMPVY